MDKISDLLERGVEQIYPNKKSLEKLLRSGKKIKLYQGFDPSMLSLHLGNLVGVLKLKQFQDQGHEVIFLIGDFTGMIGDPTDKKASRKMLTRAQVLENAKNWKMQISKILKFSGSNPAKIMFNSTWSDKISFKDLIGITSHFTFQQMIERDFFQKRIKENKPIYLHEFLYPVAQAIDCVEMNVDLEIGGSDQTFNMLCGRTLMKAVKNKEKFVLTTKLLLDNKGEKVGKTAGNALFLDAKSTDLFAGVMSFPDEVIQLGFELLTSLPLENIKGNPMGLKKQLAFEIVKLCRSDKEATLAQKEFERVVQGKKTPSNITKKTIPAGKYVLSKLIATSGDNISASEAKRLIVAGAIDINGKALLDPNVKIDITGNEILKIGKKKYLQLITKK